MSSAGGGGSEVLDGVRRYLARFVAFPSEAALRAVTLWVAHAHLAHLVHTSPRLALLSPEPGSGKTRVLELLNTLVPRPMFSFSASVATIFRSLAIEPRTLLFDEVDTVFADRGKDHGNEDLRALLNMGYRRGASIPRCVGPRFDVHHFPVYAPVALAGLGNLPDTIMSRSVIIPMRRGGPADRYEQYRSRLHEPEGEELHDALAAWSEVIGPEVADSWPQLPEGVVDRDAEVWEPLLAVADAAGRDWPHASRSACLELLNVGKKREPSLGVRLLSDLRQVFGDRDAMSTEDILSRLAALDEAPWGDLYGKPLQPRQLAKMLKNYDITSTNVKVAGRTRKGYRRDEGLWDAWERYVGSDPGEGQREQRPQRLNAESGSSVVSPLPMATTASESLPERCGAGETRDRVAASRVDELPTRDDGDDHGAEVALVADVEEPTRSTILDRAITRTVEVKQLNTVALKRRLDTAAHVVVLEPSLLAAETRQDRVAATVAMELLAEDRVDGDFASDPDLYFGAARTALGQDQLE